MAGNLTDRSGFMKVFWGLLLIGGGVVFYLRDGGRSQTLLSLPIATLALIVMSVGAVLLLWGFWSMISVPRAELGVGEVAVRTPPVVRWLTLGAFSRTVLIDRRAEFVFVTRRAFWLSEEQTYPFRAIRRVDQEFEGDRESSGISSVFLILKDGAQRVPLFRIRLDLRDRPSEETRPIYEILRQWIIPPLGQSSGALPIVRDPPPR